MPGDSPTVLRVLPFPFTTPPWLYSSKHPVSSKCVRFRSTNKLRELKFGSQTTRTTTYMQLARCRCALQCMLACAAAASLVARAAKELAFVNCVKNTEPGARVCGSALAEGVSFDWTLDTPAGVLDARLQIKTDKAVYIAWGLSPDGKMLHSDSVICSSTVPVRRYELRSYGTAMNADSCTSICAVQPAAALVWHDGSEAFSSPVTDRYKLFLRCSYRYCMSVMTFRRPLAAGSSGHIAVTPAQPQPHIWAYGPTPLLTHHTAKGAVLIPLSQGEGKLTANSSTDAPNTAGNSNDNTAAAGDGAQGSEQELLLEVVQQAPWKLANL
eukprot:14277-Heterococcus_DN1.PRE.3